MKAISIALSILGLVATLTPTPAGAQTASTPESTSDELAALSAEFGSVLRFRQLGDATTLAKGRVDLGAVCERADRHVRTAVERHAVRRPLGRSSPPLKSRRARSATPSAWARGSERDADHTLGATIALRLVAPFRHTSNAPAAADRDGVAADS